MKDQRKANQESDAGANIEVSDEQVEAALERLFATVKDEAVPAAWSARNGRSNGRSNGLPADAKDRPLDQPILHQPILDQPIKESLWQTNEQPFELLALWAQVDGNDEEQAGLLVLPDLPASLDIPTPSLNLQASQAKAAELMPERMNVNPKRRKAKRRWFSAVSAAVVVGAILFTSWGQNVMADVLNTFRVQHFETIAIDENDLNGFRQALEEGAVGTRELDLRLYGEIRQSGGGSTRTVTAEEANRLAGKPLKQLPGVESVDYMPRQELTFKLHPKAINKLIALLGGKTPFPDSVDDEPIVVKVPDSFRMTLPGKDGASSSKGFLQMASPSLDVPDEVDVEQVRQAVLGLPLLPDDLRAQLAAIGDWRTTLPVPTIAGENLRTVAIAGNDAIVSTAGYNRSVIWLQDGWMYMLSGTRADYPTEESLLKEAEGLMAS